MKVYRPYPLDGHTMHLNLPAEDLLMHTIRWLPGQDSVILTRVVRTMFKAMPEDQQAKVLESFGWTKVD